MCHIGTQDAVLQNESQETMKWMGSDITYHIHMATYGNGLGK